jgi:hypothetical protein
VAFPARHDDMDDTNVHIVELNANHFLSSENGKVSIFTERFDRAMKRYVLDRSSAADFRLLYGNRFVWEQRESKRGMSNERVPLSKFWLEHPDRRQYRELVFDPEPASKPDPNVYNLWRGFQVKPKPGDWSIWKQHLFEIGAASDEATYEFVLDWFAWMLQYPHRQGETAIVWRGRQGSGKGTIMRTMGRVVGQHFVHIHNVKHLVGNFNAHLRDALLVFSDEALWAGDKSAEGILKAMITEPTLLLEPKGRDVYSVPNRVHLGMATNNDWAAPVGVDDRRFCIVDVPDTYIGNEEYFDRLYTHLDNGGLAAFVAFLLERPIKRAPTPPRSYAAQSAALTQKLHSMPPVWQWWFQKLEDGQLLKDQDGWSREVPKTELHDDYIRFAERMNLSRRANETILGLALVEMTPKLGSRRSRAAGSDKRSRLWLLPSLKECRDHFAEALKMRHMFAGSFDDDDDD